MRSAATLAAVATFCVSPVLSQTTDGVISGRVSDSVRGAAIANSTILFSSAETNARGSAVTDADGNYSLPLLSPGYYRVRAEASSYQAQELQAIEVMVSGRLELNFRLRPLSDVWEAGLFRSTVLPGSEIELTFFGPDVDESRSALVELKPGNRSALESSISTVVSPAQVQNLPLVARDVYATLVLQPGVAASAGTGRGLGLAANGQRPTASNFLLDGVENNNSLVTGPLNVVAPEAVQEYQVSTSNFSAEFGRTSGFITNAVTRAGGSAWHGLLYYYNGNEALDANDTTRNYQGIDRTLRRQHQPGFAVGGPVWRDRLFLGLSAEYLQFRSKTAPAQFRLPTPDFYAITRVPAPPNSRALEVLRRFPAPTGPVDPATGTVFASIARPSDLDRLLVLPRIDYSLRGGMHRIMVRESVVSVKRPNFIWSPYKEFITPFNQQTRGFAASEVSLLKPGLTNEIRGSINTERLDFERRYPGLPSLVTFDPAASRIWLPGSPAFYGYRSNDHYQEIRDNLIWVHGRHVSKFGGGLLLRQLDKTISPGNFIVFRNYLAFHLDTTQYFLTSVSRTDRTTPYTDFDRNYSYKQFFFFAQDSFALTSRLNIDLGLRYENYGAPVNTGRNKDVLVQLGPGSSLAQRISTATTQLGTGDQRLYDTDNMNFAPRIGFAYRVRGNGSTVVRGAYGVYFDRPFDNLWLSLAANSFVLGAYNARNTNYLAPLDSILPGLLASPNTTFKVPNVVLYQPGLRNGYAQHLFLGMQQQVTESLNVELNATASLGRGLITSDILNRSTTPGVFGGNTLNPNLPTISYRGNQGLSNYGALTATARYRSSRLQLQVAYTFSHFIDNQSDPLRGDFFDFLFTGGKNDQGQPVAGTLIDQLLQGGIPSPVASFTRQFDSHGDRANSDFDQRHSLVAYATYAIPTYIRSSWTERLTGGWQVAVVAAARTGFPYSVFAPAQSGGLIYNNRGDVIGDPYTRSDVKGGVQLLTPSAFKIPVAGAVGSSGRNAFRGPGFASMDFSLSRSQAIPWLGDAGRLTVRADVFNVLNHANLGNPAAVLTSSTLATRTFGIASYGRRESVTGFPSVTPLDETPRQFQLMLRMEF